MAPTLYWEGPPSANPWGGYRHWVEAYPGQDEPDWSLRKPSLHALSQPDSSTVPVFYLGCQYTCNWGAFHRILVALAR